MLRLTPPTSKAYSWAELRLQLCLPSSWVLHPSCLPCHVTPGPGASTQARLSLPSLLTVNGLACMCAHTHTTRAHTHVHTYTWTPHGHTCIYMQCTHTGLHTQNVLHSCKHVCMPKYIHLQVHTHPHIYTCMQIHRVKICIMATNPCTSETLCHVHRGLCCLYPEPWDVCTVSLAPLSTQSCSHPCCS